MNETLDNETRCQLYSWLDSIPFSRPRKNLARFFADASAVVEIINYFHPKFAYENAYLPCYAQASKIDNWERLNRKVLSKLGIKLTKNQIKYLANARLEYTEIFLCQLATAIYRRNYGTIQKVLRENTNQDTDKEPEVRPSIRNQNGGEGFYCCKKREDNKL